MSRDYVCAEGADLSIGQSKMTACPWCNAQEEKLAITRYSDGLGWICFRSSCGAKGSARTGSAAVATAMEPPRRFEPKEWLGDLRSPQIDDYAGELLSRIGVSCQRGEEWYGIKSALGGNGIYYTLSDLDGREIGWQVRDRNKGLWSGKLVNTTLYAAYTRPIELGDPAGLWVVEDPLSAIRLYGRDLCAVALLGTRWPESLDKEYFDGTVYVALDPGAESDARAIVAHLRLRGTDAIQVPLVEDIHRMSQQQLDRLLETYNA